MHVLFYRRPESVTGGAANFAHFLAQGLEDKVDFTYFPRFSPSRGLKNFKAVYAEFLKKRFDIVHFNLPPTFVPYKLTSTRWIDANYLLFRAAKNRGAHVVLNIHGITAFEGEAYRPPKLSALMVSDGRRACQHADRIVVNSAFMKLQIEALYNAPNEKIVILPNGIDLSKFTNVSSSISLSGNPAILFVGHLWWIKGVDVLLKAMAKLKSHLPDAKLHIIGGVHGHKTEQDFVGLAKQLGVTDRVVFHGAVPHDKIASYYHAASICVFPSRHEAFSIALLEAMASKVPIVASDIARYKEIIKDGENGVLFKSGDPQSLSDSMSRLLSTRSFSEGVSNRAFALVQDYDWAKISNDYFSLYKSLAT